MLCVADQGVDVLEKAGSVIGRIRSDPLIRKLSVTIPSRGILVEPSILKGILISKMTTQHEFS